MEGRGGFLYKLLLLLLILTMNRGCLKKEGLTCVHGLRYTIHNSKEGMGVVSVVVAEACITCSHII